MVLSAPPLASSLPSAFQPTSRTWCVCPSNALMNLPDGSSKTLTNLSAPQVASLVPSALMATPKTVSLWPFLMSTSSLASGISKTLISPSSVGAPPPHRPGLHVPDDGFLEGAADDELAVGAERQRLDQRQVSGLDLLAVGGLQGGVDEAADVVAGAG